MGFSTSASLVVGISIAKLFTEFRENSRAHDEFDKYGNKTGRQFKEEELIGILPNGKEHIIATEKDRWGWNYNWYESIEFDGGEYVGDMFNIKLEIHKADHETYELNQMIVGQNVCNTADSNLNDGDHVVKVDEAKTNSIIDETKRQLAELFGYTGEINLYLINNLSY